MILTAKERIELTGARTKKGQIETLIKNRIRFIKRADGWPCVTWQAVHQKEIINEPQDSPNLDW